MNRGSIMENNKITITDNVKKLFAKPLPSTRSGAFYNTFPYPTKISPETIAVYIAASTEPGDTVLDTFSGSGSTGIAALLCEFPTEKMIQLAKEFDVKPKWGRRNAHLYEIGTYGSFATRALSNRLSAREYRLAVNDFVMRAEDKVGKYYKAIDPEGNQGVIRYIVWTEILICPNCKEEISYYEKGVSKNPVKFHNKVTCPRCEKEHLVDRMQFATENYNDTILKKTMSRKKRKIAWVYGSTNGKNWDREAVSEDQNLYDEIEANGEFINEPKEIEWGDLYRSGYHYGITHLHHFYTARNYRVMEQLWKLTEEYETKASEALKLLLLSYNSAHCTMMTRVVAKKSSKDFVLTSAQSGVLYISKLPVEKNIILGLKRKAKPFETVYGLLESCTGEIVVHNCSSAKMATADQSVDLVFTDPPFGDFIPYAEVNQINELWLPALANRTDEIIVSTSQNKGIDKYQEMLTSVFREISRVIKIDKYAVVVFHAAKSSIWNAFASSLKAADLEIEMSNILDKTQASFKQVVSKGGVQGDPLFLIKRRDSSEETCSTSLEIFETILAQNAHQSEMEMRRCYSLYVGKCLEKGVDVSMDASEAYEYMKIRKEKVADAN